MKTFGGMRGRLGTAFTSEGLGAVERVRRLEALGLWALAASTADAAGEDARELACGLRAKVARVEQLHVLPREFADHFPAFSFHPCPLPLHLAPLSFPG